MQSNYHKDKTRALERISNPSNITKDVFLSVLNQLKAHLNLDADQIQSLWGILTSGVIFKQSFADLFSLNQSKSLRWKIFLT